MHKLVPIEPVDYLVIGHITQDLTPNGPVLGGTAAYSALTARAIGLRVGVITATGDDLDLREMRGIRVIVRPSDYTTTFENIQTDRGRIQHIHHRAAELDASMIPETWRAAPIVHLGPVDQEIDPKIVRAFPNALIGVTPQGWLRGWNNQGQVHFTEWLEAGFVLSQSTAAILSMEDVQGDMRIIEDMLASIRILAVTEAAEGSSLYWNGDVRAFRTPNVHEVDPVGAGDVYAAAFFIRLQQTRDPWEAARFATQLAAISVTRKGLSGIPTPDEVQAHMIEVLP